MALAATLVATIALLIAAASFALLPTHWNWIGAGLVLSIALIGLILSAPRLQRAVLSRITGSEYVSTYLVKSRPLCPSSLQFLLSSKLVLILLPLAMMTVSGLLWRNQVGPAKFMAAGGLPAGKASSKLQGDRAIQEAITCRSHYASTTDLVHLLQNVGAKLEGDANSKSPLSVIRVNSDFTVLSGRAMLLYVGSARVGEAISVAARIDAKAERVVAALNGAGIFPVQRDQNRMIAVVGARMVVVEGQAEQTIVSCLTPRRGPAA